MRILLAEDDRKLNALLAEALESEGFAIDSCYDGEEALFFAKQNIHDVILLDIMLPYMTGTDVLKAIRRAGVGIPVILTTALDAVSDKVTGLDLGADDYLVKPFAFEELMARIRSVTRRPPVIAPDHSINAGDLQFLLEENQLKGPGGQCTLSNRESALLEALLRSKGQTVAREILLLKVWGPDSDVENGNLDNYIHFLRRRLSAVESGMQIKTVRGIGYCLKI